MPSSPSSPLHGVTIPVVIVGAGPVGLALALGLDRHGIRSIVLERHATTSRHSKAAGIHVRTREVLRQWDVEAPLLTAGTLRSAITLHAASDGRPILRLPFAELGDEAEDPGVLLLEQSETERLLLEELRRSDRCEVRFGTQFTALTQDRSRVSLTVRTDRGEEALQAAFVVGCDGASSSVRDAIGLPFEGLTYDLRPMLADVRVTDDRDALAWPRQRHGPRGVTTAIRLRPGLWRIIRLDDGVGGARHDGHERAVADDEVERWVSEVLGAGSVEVVWADRFRIHRRSSPRFRVGRVLLAGDAAHVHSPLGGLGMNAGIQDAHNLAWKLSSAMRGGEIDRLLDSYDVERRAVVVEQVSRTTDLATRVLLQTPAPIRERSIGVLRRLLEFGPARRRGLRALAMLDLTYPGSPLLDPTEPSAGVRLPDPLLIAPTGREVRLHRLLPAAAPLLIEVGSVPQRAERAAPGAHAAGGAPPVAVLRIGPGGHRDEGGAIRDLLDGRDGWILVRPDGHLAWARPGHARPGDDAVARALGERTNARAGERTDGAGPARRPDTDADRPQGRTLADALRRIRDRTRLDMPHYR